MQNENKKLRVLISCLFFRHFTGSEMYVFELSKRLIQDNCEVSILALDTHGPLSDMAKKEGISVYDFKQPPGYKVGDGKWLFSTPQGPQASAEGHFYKTSDANFDIIHCQHVPVTNSVLALYPLMPKISTIHSEVIDLEHPVKHESIKKFVAVRPEIKKFICENFQLSDSDVHVIYNPIDADRFNRTGTTDDHYVLFVGTVDRLRRESIYDLMEYSKNKGIELWLVGKNHSDYLQDLLLNQHVKHFEAVANVEHFVKNCTETGGILLGRTTIEGWMCGKSGWIYDIDQSGKIKSKTLHAPPSDVEKFDSRNVSNAIKQLYLNVLDS